MTKVDWMRALAAQVERMRLTHPTDELAVVFDNDGTIVDTRHLVVHLLLSYDRHHGTDAFRGITVEDVVAHETSIDEILRPFALSARLRADVRAWYVAHLRDPEAVVAAHRPYQGVFGVIRWFQLQPRMHVALNTGRPESMREATLVSLNTLGALHRIAFEPELLFMNRAGTEDHVSAAKVDGLRRLRVAGYRVVAVVDNEPDMILAMKEADDTGEILFLHADTIFASPRELTTGTVSGSTYGLSGLVYQAEVGRRVTLAWHGVNDRHNLRQFIASQIRWAELDVRRDPVGPARAPARLVRRLAVAPRRGADAGARLPRRAPVERPLGEARPEGRRVDHRRHHRARRRPRVRRRRAVVQRVDRDAGAGGFAHVRRARPGAIRQCPIDFLVPLFLAAPDLAAEALTMLAQWGVTRVSLDWRTPGARDVLDAVERLGWELNLYGVPDLESFLEAALLLPTSVTADFNFPEWNYFGRGPRSPGSKAAGVLS